MPPRKTTKSKPGRKPQDRKPKLESVPTPPQPQSVTRTVTFRIQNPADMPPVLEMVRPCGHIASTTMGPDSDLTLQWGYTLSNPGPDGGFNSVTEDCVTCSRLVREALRSAAEPSST